MHATYQPKKKLTKYQPKKEYSLRSKHNIKNATVSKIGLSGECVLQTMNEKDYYLTLTKIVLVFAKPNEPNLLANGGYDQADSQFGRYGYDNQEY